MLQEKGHLLREKKETKREFGNNSASKWKPKRSIENDAKWPETGSSVGQSIVPISQDCGFDPQSEHI